MTPALWGLASAFFFGSGVFVARLTGRAIGWPNSLLADYAIGAVGLSLWVSLTGMAMNWPSAGIAWLVVAGTSFAGGTLLFMAALIRGPVSAVTPVVSSSPVFVVMGALLLGIYPTPAQWVAIVLVMVGVLIVARGGRLAARLEPTGLEGLRFTLSLAMISSVVWAGGLLAAREAMELVDEIQALWLTRIVTVSVVAAYILGTSARTRVRFPVRWWPVLLVQGLFGLSGMVCYFIGAAGEGAGIVAVASAPFAIVTAFLAWLFLREPIPASQWAGIAIVAFGGATLAYVG